MSNRLIYNLFKEQVEKIPAKIAISYNNKQISYKELDEMSDQVYNLIQSSNILNGKPIAIDYDTPIEAVTRVLGIIKSCTAYLTSDSEYSYDNYQKIFESFGSRYVLSEVENSNAAQLVVISDNYQEVGNTEFVDTSKTSESNEPLLVVCRTGYKREVEGSVLCYKNISNWLNFNIEVLKVNFKNTLFITAPAMELRFPLWLAPLLTGGTVNFLTPAEGRMDVLNLQSRVFDYSASTVILPLSYLSTLVQYREYSDVFTNSVENIISVGEEVFNANEFKFYTRERGIRWHNFFGFPEIQMITTVIQENIESKTGFKHIGKPISNTNMYILNHVKQPVSVSVSGELYASGCGIPDNIYLREYLGSEFFVKNPFGINSILYRSGFKAKWLSDGKIELDGRFDERVMINGHRIYLKEIEAALHEHPSIYDCAVGIRPTDKGTDRLLVFFVPREQISFEKLEEYLKKVFPICIFPIGFVKLLSIPRTSMGNVDIEYLKSVNFVDTVTTSSMEKIFSEEYEIDYIKVITEEALETPESIDIRHFIPDISKDYVENPQSEVVTSNEEAEHMRSMAVIYGGDLITEGEPKTLSEALERAVARKGQNQIIYIGNDGIEQFQTYAQLLEEAERILAGLRKLGLKPQDKIIMQLDKNEDFIPVFWACTLGGIVPVPISVPKLFSEQSNETNILHNVWKIIDKPIILTSSELEKSVLSLCDKYDFEGLQISCVEELRGNNPDNVHYRSNPEDLALLLFTSGSTGIPKGVRQNHRSILAREIGTTQLNGFNSADISINWMPLEHVGGIVMFHIKDVYLGCTQIQVKTEFILANPLKWLDMITKYRATITWAPNFAFALINDRVEQVQDVNWDLSSMRFILNGGEAINASTAKKFIMNLEVFGLRKNAMHPSWGMSETCSGVLYSELLTSDPDTGIHIIDKNSLKSVIRKATSDQDKTVLVELGKPIPGAAIRITDSNNRLVSEGVVGRIQIKGSSVTTGYYNNSELNKEVFTDNGWFTTGDLGFIYNGRVTISGREKDVIIINGVNYNNSEIEAAVEEAEGVETSFTAACAVRDCESDTDKLIIFFCSSYREMKNKIDQVKEIRMKVIEKTRINPDYIIPVEREEIPKTSIGKIQRVKLGRLFEEGYFNKILGKLHIDNTNSNAIPSWFFKKEWYVCEPFLTDEKHWMNTYLIFEGELEQCEGFVKVLQDKKSKYIRVRHGNTFKRVNVDMIQLNYNDPDHYKRLFKTIIEEGMQIENILHFGCFNKLDINPFETKVIRRHQNIGINSLLYIIKELNNGFRYPIKLFVISNYTQLTSKEDGADFGKFTLPGFLKSASLECTWLYCYHIDFESDSIDNNIPYIINELRNCKKDCEVAYRKGKRLVPLLSDLSIYNCEVRKLPVSKNEIYLVTGGLGGIGLHISKVLMEKLGAKLVIIGRTQLPDRKQWDILENNGTTLSKRIKAYKELECTGCEFLYEACDLDDRSTLSEVIVKAQSKWGKRLSGIFHLAGMGNLEYHWKVMDRHWVTEECTDTFEAMFKTKIYGTLNLHSLLKDNPDAVFVAFSSISSFFGASTFSAYAAANSFIDSFCLYRRNRGYPNTYCLNWSTWDNVGMSENNPTNMTNAMISSGYKIIPIQQGINSMLLSLCLDQSSLYIGLSRDNTNIGRALKRYPEGNQIIKIFYSIAKHSKSNSELLQEKLTSIILSDYAENGILKFYKIESGLLEDKEQFGQQIVFADADIEPLAVKLDLTQTDEEKKLLDIWMKLLNKTYIGINDNFFELGGQSLKAATLVANIHKEFNVKISIGEVFKKPTVKELAKYIKSKGNSMYLSIQPVEKKEFYRLSPAQKRMFILYQIDGANINYNIPSALIVEGRLDKERFVSSLNELIRRHESLRTSFDIVDGEPVQLIQENVNLEIVYGEIGEEKIESVIERFIKPFDLRKAPLLRVKLIFMECDRHLLLFDMHHIISDGTSMAILIREFVDLYEGRKLPALSIQYKDFSEWQNQILTSETIKKQEEYWISNFTGEIPVLNMPTDYQRSRRQQIEGDRVELELEKDLVYKLNKLSLESGATLYMLLIAAYNVLLSKYTGQEDIVIGVPVAGRPHIDLENIIGMFVNTLAIRNNTDGSKTFIEFLENVKENSLKAFENQDYQFEELIEKLNLKRDLSRKPLFDTMFSMVNLDIPEIRINNLKFTPYKFMHRVSKYDLTLNATITDFDIKLYFQFSSNLFLRETVERLAAHYTNILYDIADNPNKKLFEIEMMSKAQKHDAIFGFNNTVSEYPKDKTIHMSFEEQVERIPNKKALVCGEELLSYKELNEKANRLARILRDKGVKPDSIVGLIAEPSIEMIIGIIGVLKAGGAYLPIDIKLPEGRIDFILKDSNTNILLTDKFDVRKITFDGQVIYINDEIMGGMVGTNIRAINTPENLAYVIYTSGTTGVPKGVMLEHKGLVNYSTWFSKKAGLTQRDETVILSSICFDLSYTALYPALISGCTIHLMPESIYMDPKELLGYISKNRITFLKTTPSFFNILVNSHVFSLNKYCDNMRLIVLGGEKINLYDVERYHSWYPQTVIMNHYGPTETTIGAISQVIDFDSFEKYKMHPAIGKPIDNMKVFILDKHLRPLPLGITGEIYISGDGLARGYLNRTDLNTVKFISNSFLDGKNEYLYKTGDLGRFLSDGSVEFLKRMDQQVKIHGYRVELDEVKNQLMSHPKIRDTAVVARKNNQEDLSIFAYIVSDTDVNVSELRSFLSKQLPGYMIPSYFIKLKKLPLTPNGKIDMNALEGCTNYLDIHNEYTAPRNNIEKSLADIWSSLLGREKIGIYDNFFEIGGTSLTIIKAHACIENMYPQKVKVTDLFSYPSIAKLAEYMENEIESQQKRMLPMKCINLPEEYFLREHAVNETSVYKLRFKEDLYEGIKKIAFMEQVETADVLLSMFIYFLMQVTGQKSIEIQSMVRFNDCVVSLSIDLENINGFPGLFRFVKQGQEEKKISYKLLDVYKQGVVKGPTAIMPFCFRKSNLSTKRNLTEIYDMILEIEEEGANISLLFEFTPNKFQEDKMEFLVDTYIKLVEFIAEQYESIEN